MTTPFNLELATREHNEIKANYIENVKDKNLNFRQLHSGLVLFLELEYLNSAKELLDLKMSKTTS